MKDRNVLVIGGGIAGVTAALELAEMGIPSTIVERENRLGGRPAFLPARRPRNATNVLPVWWTIKSRR